MLLADPAEERDALLAGGRLAAEVHVLDHEVDGFARERVEARRRGVRGDDAGAVQGQQYVEGRAHGLAVVDHEYGALPQAVLKSLLLLVVHGLGCFVSRNRCNATHSLCRRPQTVRLATAGEIVEALRAGCSAAASPISQIASTPPTR